MFKPNYPELVKDCRNRIIDLNQLINCTEGELQDYKKELMREQCKLTNFTKLIP